MEIIDKVPLGSPVCGLFQRRLQHFGRGLGVHFRVGGRPGNPPPIQQLGLVGTGNDQGRAAERGVAGVSEARLEVAASRDKHHGP